MDVVVAEYPGPHTDLAWSFRLAEDSEQLLASYLELGRVWVARGSADEIVGHLQAVARDADTWEVTNTAVVEEVRGQGVGRALLERASDEARRSGAARLVLATAAADTGALRFYQRCGFRMTHVVRDAFGTDRGYPPGITVDGIPMLDQVWFEHRLPGGPR